MDKILGRVDGRLIHHLQTRRDDTGADNVRDAFAPVIVAWKADQQGPRAGRFGQNADRDLRHHGEQSFGAGQQSKKVVPFGVEMLAVNPQDFAIDQDRFEAKHIVGRQPIFEAVNAARIFRDVTPDRTSDLTGRIGRIVKPVAFHRLRYAKVRHPRLHPHAAVVVIHLQHLVEFPEPEQNAIFERQGTARQ